MPTPSLALWAEGLAGSMFVPDVAVLEKILRPIFVYAFLILLLRIFGKRELAQLNPFDLVVLLSLSNTVQNAIIGPDNSLTGGLIGATTLCAVNYAVVRFLFRHRRLDQIIEGRPTVLIENGKLVKRNLRRELMTIAELHSVAHRQGFATLDEVEQCCLEPGGTFSIRAKAPRQAERQHVELLGHLDRLQRQVAELRAAIEAREGESRAEDDPSRP